MGIAGSRSGVPVSDGCTPERARDGSPSSGPAGRGAPSPLTALTGGRRRRQGLGPPGPVAVTGVRSETSGPAFRVCGGFHRGLRERPSPERFASQRDSHRIRTFLPPSGGWTRSRDQVRTLEVRCRKVPFAGRMVESTGPVRGLGRQDPTVQGGLGRPQPEGPVRGIQGEPEGPVRGMDRRWRKDPSREPDA
jgi:hypothetical protein